MAQVNPVSIHIRRLAVVPSDPLEAYVEKGRGDLLKDYYNPCSYFDEVYCLSPLEKTAGFKYGMHVIPTSPEQLPSRIRELGIDIVRAYGGYWACDMACENKVEGVPVVVSVHDTNPQLLFDSILNADYVLPVSNAVKELLLNKGVSPERIHEFTNRVDFRVFYRCCDEKLRAEFYARYPGKYHILHVGRKAEQKNLDTLIRALVELGPEYFCIFVGKGREDTYRRLAEQCGVDQQCYFIESVPNAELAKYYSFCDCMCTPSRWEGFGLVFVEALACEAVVVTSDIAPMNEYITNNVIGVLVKDFENPSAIAEAIVRVCQDESLRNTIQSNARKAAEPFRKERVDQLEMNLYKQFLREVASRDNATDCSNAENFIRSPLKLSQPDNDTILRVCVRDIKLKGSNFEVEKCPQYLSAKAMAEKPDLSIEETPYYNFAVEQTFYMFDNSLIPKNASERCRRFLELFNSIKQHGYHPEKHGHIEVLIDDKGEVKLLEGHHRLAIVKAINPDQIIEVRVKERSKGWLDFKHFIFKTCQYKTSAYQPILHPDFANWNIHYDNEQRFDAILRAIGNPKGKSLIDIGPQLGYFSFKLARLGAEVTGVEIQKRWVDASERLNLINGTNINFHCNDFVNVLCHYQNRKWDYGLFLNVFHWFAAQKKGNIEAVRRGMELLSKRIDNLFFSTGSFQESCISSSPLAKSVKQNDIPNWICDNTQYSSYKYLLTDEKGRDLFLFSKICANDSNENKKTPLGQTGKINQSTREEESVRGEVKPAEPFRGQRKNQLEMGLYKKVLDLSKSSQKIDVSKQKQATQILSPTERKTHYLDRLPVYNILAGTDLSEESVRKSPELAVRLRTAGMKNTNLENYWKRVSFIAQNCHGRVLELGCGCGNITRYISQNRMVMNVCAVDMQPEYIDKLREYSFDKVEPICADVLTYKFSGKFNCVVIAELIEHLTLSQECRLISNLYAVLNQGATLIITTPIGFMPDADHVRGFTTSEFRDHVQQYYGKILKRGDNSIQQFAVVNFEACLAEKTNPRVSVVLPTYNHLKFLPQAIESVLSQTFSDFELIIVNDGSTDGTREYLDSLKDPRISIIHQKNKHLPEALNTGFRAARGELLTWVSADNYCAPTFLEVFVSTFDANPKAGLAYSAFAHINEHDQIISVTRCPDMDYKRLLLRFPGMASFMYRRICQEKVGFYDSGLEGAEDWDMWLRIAEQFPIIYVLDILCYYRKHDKSLTAQKPNMISKSSQKVFQNAINRLRLESLYPSLEYCKDRATAEFHACFDFGTALIRSRYGLQTGTVCKFLEKAFSLRPDSLEATSNLAIACALSGQWEKTVPLLKMMQKTENPKVLSICRDIIEAYQAQKTDLLLSTDLFEIDKNNSELFQSGQGRGRDLFHEQKITSETSMSASIDEKNSRDSAVDYFLKAGKELNGENFETAIDYMQKYRSMIDYSKFPRILNKSRKRGEIDVSVIIVTYNRTEDLKRCLESLSKQNDANFEVIVVDNGGSDFEVFQQYVDQYIKCPINFILSEGRNIGACCAKGKIIAFLDDDALVPSNYVSSIKSAFDQFDIFGLRGKAYPKSSSNTNNHLNIYDLGDRPFPSYCNQEGNSAWLLEVYKSMDGMDPLLFGHEGSDLTFRIIKEYKQPNKIIYWPHAIIYHDYGTADKLRLKKRIHQRNANYLKYKHKTDIFVNRKDIEKYPLPLKQTQVLLDKASSTTEGAIFQPTRCARHPVKPLELPEVKYPNTVSAASTNHLNPKVSIVISCYNCENFLPECLDSIRNQTLNDWELFLLDDASTDGTRRIIEKYAQIDERIKPYYFRDNKGPYVRRNFAIERANSDFIVIQDADDIMYPPKLEILYNEIAKDERLEVVGSFYRMCLEQSKGFEYADKIELPITHDEIIQQYSLERYVCWHGSAIIRKSMFEQIGLYDEYPYGSDKFWLAKAAEYSRCSNEVRFKNVPEYLTLKREHSSSQQGLLPTLDPRSRRARFQTYWEYKLLKIREKLHNNPDVDIKAELRNCKCDDYIKRYGCLFEQWESEPLDNDRLYGFISEGLRRFRSGKYVSCIIILDSVEKIINDITKRFKNYDLLRAMAHFKIDRKQQCLRYLNREIQNHNNPAAGKFLSDYFENNLRVDVQNWCSQNSRHYNLQLVDLENESCQQRQNNNISEPYVSEQQSEQKGIQQSSCCKRSEPLVSVIMPAYNAAEHIAEAIESVLTQNYKNFELLIINDGSTDNTEEVVLGFKDERIRYFRQENRGLAATHNVGIKKSRGEFIIKLDSDDMMMPDFIARHLQELENHSDTDLVYCDDCLINEDSKPIRVIERPEYTDRKMLIRDLFRCGFPVVPFRTCIRRSVFDKIGFFDENLRMAEDYDMMRRFVKMGLKIQHLPGALYLRRMTPDSLSRNFTSQNAKFHFDVVGRFTDTFTCDELFPDVAWDRIAPQMRQLHAKCLAAGTYLAIGQEYVKTNAIEYSRTAFDRACSELNDCVKMDPKNQGLRQLSQKFKLIQAKYTEAPQQVVS